MPSPKLTIFAGAPREFGEQYAAYKRTVPQLETGDQVAFSTHLSDEATEVKSEEKGMNYQIGDKVKVVWVHETFIFGPFRRFGLPHRGFPRGRITGTGTIIQVIEPSRTTGVTNQGGYEVRLDDGTAHFYVEAELRPVR